MTHPNHLQDSGAGYGATGASHPAIIRAVKIYGQDWATLSANEDAFLRALRAADVRKTKTVENAGRSWGFGSIAWDAVNNLAARRRDADYAKALAAFEAAEMEDA